MNSQEYVPLSSAHLLYRDQSNPIYPVGEYMLSHNKGCVHTKPIFIDFQDKQTSSCLAISINVGYVGLTCHERDGGMFVNYSEYVILIYYSHAQRSTTY